MLLALVELAGFTGVGAELQPVDAAPVRLYGDGRFTRLTELPRAAARLALDWHADQRSARPDDAPPPTASDRHGIAALLRSDPCARWSLPEVARRLAVSPRQLQRNLASEGVSFSELLQRVRVDEAVRLLEADERMTLAEVAFCSGFSDQAHFARLFRRFNDVPPSGYRALIAMRSRA